MVLDKALLLKGLAGAASVGGVAVGGYYISGSGKSEKKQVNQSNTPVVVNVDQEDELGLPTNCEVAKECDITEDQIKKIKFQALGDDNEGEITVNPESGINVTLKIEGENDSKKYIFTNTSSSAVTIKRGEGDSKKVTLKGSGKTRFTVDGKKLKLLEPGTYGLPARCKDDAPCKLTKDDLSLIKFSGFGDDGEAEVDDFSTNQIITLTIEDNKYIFTNNSSFSINIKKSGVTVELNGEVENEFTLESDKKLKKVELWDFGLPKACDLEGGLDSKTCKLTSRDLKKVKFKDLGNNPTITGLNNNESITLVIQKVKDSSYPDGRKYTFTPNSSDNVKITSSSETQQSITLTKGEGNEFKKEGDFLVNVPKRSKANFQTDEYDKKINSLGLPTSCTFTNKASGKEKSIECDLSKEELKSLKFSVGDVSSISGGQEKENNFGDPKTYKIKIEDVENEDNFKDKDIKITFLNKEENYWSSDLVIGGEDKTLTIANNSNTEFKINSSNKLEKAWKIDNLSALVGLKCPKGDDSSGNECVLKENDGSIKVFVDGSAKDFKPADSSTIESNISFAEDKEGFNQGIKFAVDKEINGSGGFNLEKDSYEIRRINGKGWRLAKRVN